jgi:hypothetical protein
MVSEHSPLAGEALDLQLLAQNSIYKSPLRLRCKSWIVQIVLLSSSELVGG